MHPNEGWEHFWHMADIGVRGWGTSIETAFERVGVALTAVVTDPGRVRPKTEVAISCSESDHELLLMDWLNALIYEMAVKKMLFSQYRVRIHGERLRSIARGEEVDVGRHQPAVEIKGATATCLEVSRTESGLWQAQCVLDV